MSDVPALAAQAKEASRKASQCAAQVRSQALRAMARALLAHDQELITANQADLQQAKMDLEQGKMSQALYARLKLSEKRIHELAESMQQIAAMDDPLGQIQVESHPQVGLTLQKVSVPIGVLAVIFESRPDALPQIMSLAVKTGNGLLLKGGSEAKHSNRALFSLLNRAASEHLPAGLFALLETRSDVAEILALDESIDLIIPRGSTELVKRIQSQTRIPVLGHAEGICHVYVDQQAARDMAINICLDGKINYPAACNAVETILLHESWFPEFHHQLMGQLRDAGVEVFAGPRLAAVTDLPMAPSLAREYGDLAITLELVSSVQQAVEHINRFGSGHTDSIVTEHAATAEAFLSGVDSACVFHNVSTRFADGYRFGFGAEVGISTHRLHARGPVGLDGLMTYAYRLRGDGQTVGKPLVSAQSWPLKAPSAMIW